MEPRPDAEEGGPWSGQGAPPDWLGDVSAGVEAWTRRSGAGKQDRHRRVDDDGPARPISEDPEPDHEAIARKILLDQLTGQARSRKELADKLAKRLVPDEIANRLLDRFEEVGLVDDEAFARSWIASRQPGKGLARRALAQELRRKGVDDEVAREALDEIDPEEEREVGRALVRKKLRAMSRLDEQAMVRRLVGMLARKGYSPGMAFAIVREELAGAAADVDVPESDL